MDVACTPALNSIMYILKNISLIMYIIVPILTIISFSMLLVKSVIDPDNKKIQKKLQNITFALIIIFMIPTIVNAFMFTLGNKYTISSCYINSKKPNTNNSFIKTNKGDKKSVIAKSDDYEPGEPRKLDFSCTSSKVKTQFSCETLKIVENHLYDFNYNNFRSVIASYGGFDNYVKSLGGVFSEYYGKQLNVETELEFQKVAEYTFGFMYMYGTDYLNGSGDYHYWGDGTHHSDDAFYPGNMRASYETYWFDAEFDEVISGTGRHQDLVIATECGPAATTPHYKGGILKRGVTPKKTFVTRFKDLRPGDIMYFFDEPVGNKAVRSTWGRGRHNVLVGEVYDDKIVIYDGGSHFQTTRNMKRVMKMVETEAEEYAEVRREFGFGGWAAERFKELQR